MLRDEVNETLKKSMKAKEKRTVSTVRLILAAMKDRDIAARGKGNHEGIDDAEVLAMLQSMVKQRHETKEICEKGGRLELAEQEAEEIAVIERFLPEPLDEESSLTAVEAVMEELGAESLKDMGRTMAALRERYAGRMDFAKASAIVKKRLG